MKLSGWGKYPVIEAERFTPGTVSQLMAQLALPGSLIPRGMGRSYGDSALAPQVISTARLNQFVAFNAERGLLTCGAGVSFNDILQLIVPNGWFLPVTPGTRHISVGGAIASDVHGKNHHIDGTFCDHLESIVVATVSHGLVTCSRHELPDLFHATCGGMGLTGVIVEASFRLKKIDSAFIRQTTCKAANLAEALQLFAINSTATYSVAWIDCLSTGKHLGRSLVMLGEHAQDGELVTGGKGRLAIPVDMPAFVLNRHAIAAFNELYYRRVRQPVSHQRIHYQPFFYPLDGIGQWNRLYGKNGFTQYQFVLPVDAGLVGMTTILERIAASKRGSFLAVLKAFGKANDNYLSFPMAGYTLALDFKIDKGLFPLLEELDSIVTDHGGRLYLSKDARMSEHVFKQGYPRRDEFCRIRASYGADRLFHSLQSRRLGL